MKIGSKIARWCAGWAVLAGVGTAWGGVDYYVNPNNQLASDDYDGTAAVWAGGESRVGPKQTLSGAMAIEGLKAGDVVHAAEGVYDEGMGEYVSGATNRVAVKGGVGLVADGARDKTIIIGAPCANPDNLTTGLVSVGIGPSAVRSVFLYGDAYIKGFTITGGFTPAGQSGGGIQQSSTSCAIDCLITNNVCGWRGTGGNAGTYIRCFVRDNVARTYYTDETHTATDKTGDYGLYMAAAVIGTVITGADVYYGNGIILNCHFDGGRTWGTSLCPVYNSFIQNDNGNKAYTNCVLGKSFELQGSSVMDSKTCVRSSTYSREGIADENYRPLADSVLKDAGSAELYERNFPSKWKRFMYEDIAGGLRTVGEIDVGPGEYDPYPIAASTGLNVTRAAASATNTAVVTVARNYTSEKLCTGFTYGNETVDFADWPEGYVWTSADGAVEYVTPIYAASQTNWYVNAVTGSDTNRGYSVYAPKKTLTGIMTNRVSGDVVHAAAGTYDEGWQEANEQLNRVIIPNGVGLVSDDAGHAATTVIEGYTPSYVDATDGQTKYGGAGSVRCVASSGTGYVKGFTLRNGSTTMRHGDSYNYNGGGITGGAAIDCVITNCRAIRGGAVSDATLIRCRLYDCDLTVTGTNVWGEASGKTIAIALYGGSAYDSYGNGNVSSLNFGPVVNCYWEGSFWNNSGYCRAYNTYIDHNNNGIAYTNCVYRYTKANVIMDDKTVQVKNPNFDTTNGVPFAGDTVFIDTGDLQHYSYPAAWAHEAGKDINGNPRVMNGKIDIGPGEFDWRPAFAAALPAKGTVMVVDASANVTTNAPTGLVFADGDAVTLTWQQNTKGESSFTIAQTGSGTVTVRVNGAILEGTAAGVYSFRADAGTHVIEIAYGGTGTATLANLRAARKPMVLLVR